MPRIPLVKVIAAYQRLVVFGSCTRPLAYPASTLLQFCPLSVDRQTPLLVAAITTLAPAEPALA